MPISLLRDGEIELFKALLKEPLTLRLYTNELVIDKNMNYDDFEQLSSESGYEPQILIPSKWVYDEIKGKFTAMHPGVEFIFSGPLSKKVFGSFVTKQVKGKPVVLWAETAPDAPVIIYNRGDKVIVNPIIRFKD